MKLRLAVLADIHYAPDGRPSPPRRRGDIGDLLLLRAVHRINRHLRPDLVVVAGDLLDDGTAPGSGEALQRMRAALEGLRCPWIALPGNHDGDADAFYRVFDRPPDPLDLNGFRLLAFQDPEEPGWNARRTVRDLERMAEARAGFGGPLVALHHAPLFPAGATDCPYGFTNADAVVDAMRRHGFVLSVSGHDHRGVELLRSPGPSHVAAPALCESPFRFLEIEIAGGADAPAVRTRRHALSVPAALGLSDCHIHTPLAYCNQSMDTARALELAADLGLAGIGFSEHSDQLYFPREELQLGVAHPRWETLSRPACRRVDAYLAALAAADCPAGSVGFEVEATHRGTQMLLPADAARAAFRLGAIHSLPERSAPRPDPVRMADEYLHVAERFLRTGIDALAHPFRVFRRAGLPVPPELFTPVARMLKENGVVAEVNFHTNEPEEPFFRLCIESGVGLSFGSDSHTLHTIGDFAPHLDFLQQCGYDGDPRDLVVDLRGRG